MGAPWEFEPHWHPLLPPCPYSDGASESKEDGKRSVNYVETTKGKQVGRWARPDTLTFPTQVTFML